MALSKNLLEAALEGLETQRQRLDEQIQEVRALLGRRGPGRPKSSQTAAAESQAPGTGRKKRRISAAARKRMAEAQKKRWAAVKNAKG